MDRVVDSQQLAARYASVKASIPPDVTLVAVSKTRSVAEVQALYATPADPRVIRG